MSTETTTRSPAGTGGDPSGRRSELSEVLAGIESEGSVEVDPQGVAVDEAEERQDTAKQRRAADRAARKLIGTFADYPLLMEAKPREGYIFHSDYFRVDDQFATIMAFFHREGANDSFGPFWGLDRIPTGLAEGVTTVVFEQVQRMGERWITDHMKSSDKLDKLDSDDQADGASRLARRKAEKNSSDLEIIAGEIQDGASYLSVHNRLLVRANTLTDLDEAVEKIENLYTDRFGTLSIAAYPGEQRRELSTVFGRNAAKRGPGFHHTSVEFAGSHSLVTNGLNDPSGEYVGNMVGDMNTSAVLFDVNTWPHHVVVADSAIEPAMGRAYVADMWGSKISQSAMLSNSRVVHIVLDGARLDTLGPSFDRLTARVDMHTGDINMLEMFGEETDELGIFPAHLEKLSLMVEELLDVPDIDRTAARGALNEILTLFYVDKKMWVRNAGKNRDELRLVNLDHTEVPRLQDLVSYFDTAYKSTIATVARDENMLRAYNALRLLFTNLLDNNGSLFNTHTSDAIDGVHDARRVIYDFSGLLRRGRGVAMAQLVNTIGFAVDSLGLGDVVIIHGTEHVADSVKAYITQQLEYMSKRGGRVAYLYNDVDKMLGDSEFNKFDAADWTILGTMRESTVAKYQEKLSQDIPPDLERLVTTRGQGLGYLRRGHTNVVFHIDLALGTNPRNQARRDELLAGAEDFVSPLEAASLARQQERATREEQRDEKRAVGPKRMTRNR